MDKDFIKKLVDKKKTICIWSDITDNIVLLVVNINIFRDIKNFTIFFYNYLIDILFLILIKVISIVKIICVSNIVLLLCIKLSMTTFHK